MKCIKTPQIMFDLLMIYRKVLSEKIKISFDYNFYAKSQFHVISFSLLAVLFSKVTLSNKIADNDKFDTVQNQIYIDRPMVEIA